MSDEIQGRASELWQWIEYYLEAECGHLPEYLDEPARANIRNAIGNTLMTPAPPNDVQELIEAEAWLVEWVVDGETWIDVHADEPRAIDQGRLHKGTVTALGRLDTLAALSARNAVLDQDNAEAMEKLDAFDKLFSAEDVWTDYGSGFRVHFSFKASSDMAVVERVNAFRARAALSPIPAEPR